MRFIRLLLAMGFSWGLVRLHPMLLPVPASRLAYLLLTLFLGEYILPVLCNRSRELFDLDRRVEGALPTLEMTGGWQQPRRVRIFVLDDDAPEMTWVGFRTLLVSRGCYNLRDAEFRCALQEAWEQRVNLRGLMLLFATVGNPVFLLCRVFCLVGRGVLRVLGGLIGLMVSFRHAYHSTQIGASIGDGLYRFFSFIFLFISHVSVFVPYAVPLMWADWDIDRRLQRQHLAGALERLLDEIQHARYTGRFLREWGLIMRPPVSWRQRRLAQDAGALRQAWDTAEPRQARPSALSAFHWPHRSPGGGGLRVPEELRQLRPSETGPDQGGDQSPDGDSPRHKIKIVKVTRRH